MRGLVPSAVMGVIVAPSLTRSTGWMLVVRRIDSRIVHLARISLGGNVMTLPFESLAKLQFHFHRLHVCAEPIQEVQNTKDHHQERYVPDGADKE